MTNKEKKEKYLQKQKIKRNVRSVLSISLLIFIVVLAAFATSFYLYTRNRMGEVAYPKSPLTKMMDASYSYKTDTSLPTIIQCPTIPVMMNVAGKERHISDDGCVFAYGNGLYISAYETNDGAYNILSSKFASDLYAGEMAGELLYESAQSDVGYFNGYPSEYQAGKISIYSTSGRISREIYVLSIMMDMGLDKRLMLAVSTVEEKGLYEAGILLQSIGYTVMDISRSAASDSREVAYTDEALYGEWEKAPSVAAGSGSGGLPSEETQQQAEPASLAWKDYAVDVPQSYPEASIVMEYDNRLKTPSDALLYSPDGTETYAPSYWNDGLDGSIRFSVASPEVGTWIIKINEDIDLGTFSTYCLEKDDFGNPEGMEAEPVQDVASGAESQ